MQKAIVQPPAPGSLWVDHNGELLCDTLATKELSSGLLEEHSRPWSARSGQNTGGELASTREILDRTGCLRGSPREVVGLLLW
jgi:hypothetical protein